MFKKRIDQRRDWTSEGWSYEDRQTRKIEVVAKIQELLDVGYKVQAGWFATSVRGYHNYVILWKEKS